MNKYFYTALTLFLLVPACGSVTIDMSDYNFDSNEISINITSTVDIVGFELDLLSTSDSFSITDVSSDFGSGTLFNGENTIFFVFGTLSSGVEYTLDVTVNSGNDGSIIYIYDYVFSDAIGQIIDVEDVTPICPDASIDLFECSSDSLSGCTDINACNYNTWAESDNQSCYYDGESVCYGYCNTSIGDCEFGPSTDDGNQSDEYYLTTCYPDSICGSTEFPCCPYPQDSICGCAFQTQPGSITSFIWSDNDNLGSYFGCTDALACNYDSGAVASCSGNGYGPFCGTAGENCCCEYPEENYECDGSCANNLIMDCKGDCGGPAIIGENGACCYSYEQDCAGICFGDTDESTCSGCTDDSDENGDGEVDACNYNSELTITDNDQCYYCYQNDCSTYPKDVFRCNGNCVTDFNGNGICDENEVMGCIDDEACNYNPDANTDDQSCILCYDNDCILYPSDSFSCDGDCKLCTVDGDCVPCYNNDCDIYPSEIYNCTGACINDLDGNNVCDENEILGCTEEAACNYDFIATNDDGSCYIPTGDCGCCSQDNNGDGICETEICFNDDCDIYPPEYINCLTGDCKQCYEDDCILYPLDYIDCVTGQCIQCYNPDNLNAQDACTQYPSNYVDCVTGQCIKCFADDCGLYPLEYIDCVSGECIQCYEDDCLDYPLDEFDCLSGESLSNFDNTISVGVFISSLYPNPFNPDVFIDVYSQLEYNGSLYIYDVLGKRVQTIFAGKFNYGFNQFVWNASSYNSGMYFVVLNSEGKTMRKKIIYLK